MDIQLNWTTCFGVAGFIAANPAVRQALGWVGRAALTVNWRGIVVPATVALLALALLTESPAIAQSRRGRQSTSQAAGRDPALNAAVASFEGTLRAITKKDFTVDLDNGNTVEFKIGKKTEFYVGEKKVTARDLAPEAIVKVEGSKDGFGILTASKVTVKPPAP